MVTTQTLVNQVMQQIAYKHTLTTTLPDPVQIDWTFSDGELSATGSTTVTIEGFNNIQGDTVSYIGTPIQIDADSNLTLTTSLSDFNGFSILAFAGIEDTPVEGDTLSIQANSDITISNGKVYYQNTEIGTYGLFNSISQSLLITLTASVSPQVMEALMKSIVFSTTSTTLGDRTVQTGIIASPFAVKYGLYTTTVQVQGEDNGDGDGKVNGVLFQANDGTNGTELWVSDGTEVGTVLLKNINTAQADPMFGGGEDSGSPQTFTMANDSTGTIFFGAKHDSNSYSLWKTDGTAAGTVMVKDLGSGQFIQEIVPFSDGRLLLRTSNSIWISSDGTAEGTTKLTDTMGEGFVSLHGGVSEVMLFKGYEGKRCL